MARKTLLLLVLLVACSGLGGCGALRYMTYVLFGGGNMKTVDPVFSELRGRSVAIVIFADQSVRQEHYRVELEMELSMVIAKQLRDNVKGVKVVDPRRILSYQAQNIDWQAMEKTRMGKLFDAEYVLYVSLVEFTTREPGSPSLYRGRITAEASAWDTSLPERDARRWYAGDLRITFPEKAPIGMLGQNDDKIRRKTEYLFAEKLVRKFHKHKVRREP